MKYILRLWLQLITVAVLSGGVGSARAAEYHLKVLGPATYLPGTPMLVRVEVLEPDGHRAWDLWDAEASLSTPTAGVVLSTNRVRLWNGLGTALLVVTNSLDFDLAVAVGDVQTNRTILCNSDPEPAVVSGTLPEGETIWSGVVNVTADVIVPTNGSLTIQPGTWVLIKGATISPNGTDIEVKGSIEALGTEQQPINFTCSSNGLNWGEIRHNNALPSSYRHCTFTRAGRAVGGGHTGTPPTFRVTNSRITFEDSEFTDNIYNGATIGKVMQSSGSELVMRNCVWARARMGPEIGSTSLLLANSYITEMLGPDDSDGIYLHSQRAGQDITIADTVVAQGDDDGIDTLGSTVTVTNCIVRNYRNTNEDSKGISVFGGEVRVWHSLIVNNTCGIASKDATAIRVRVDQSTIVSVYDYALGAFNKTGTMFPTVDIRATNCILRALNPLTNSVFTSYNPADIQLYYCDTGEAWAAATGCIVADPEFVDESGFNYHLQPGSPCIDAGDPGFALDADGSRADMGYYPFLAPPPQLLNPRKAGSQFLFDLLAFTNRTYLVEVSTNLASWTNLLMVTQTNDTVPFADPWTNTSPTRYYRAKVAP